MGRAGRKEGEGVGGAYIYQLYIMTSGTDVMTSELMPIWCLARIALLGKNDSP